MSGAKMNAKRAAWAAAALERFESLTKSAREDSISDLICDLGHLADREGINFTKELNRALCHLHFERFEEFAVMSRQRWAKKKLPLPE